MKKKRNNSDNNSEKASCGGRGGQEKERIPARFGLIALLPVRKRDDPSSEQEGIPSIETEGHDSTSQ